MHYYQFNIGDYASHTSRLSPMEDLAYRRLLDLYYLNEQPLDGCVTNVAREIGLVEHVSSVEYVLGKFFTFSENVFKQKRIDSEIKKFKSNAKNKSKAGKASAKARREKALKTETGVEQVLNTEPTNEQLTINHKPITNNHKTTNKDNGDKSPKKRFISPSNQEVVDYFEQRAIAKNILIDRSEPDKFFSHYESNGWMVGKNKMKDWHSAVNGWISRINQNATQQPQISQQPAKAAKDAVSDAITNISDTDW